MYLWLSHAGNITQNEFAMNEKIILLYLLSLILGFSGFCMLCAYEML